MAIMNKVDFDQKISVAKAEIDALLVENPYDIRLKYVASQVVKIENANGQNRLPHEDFSALEMFTAREIEGVYNDLAMVLYGLYAEIEAGKTRMESS